MPKRLPKVTSGFAIASLLLAASPEVISANSSHHAFVQTAQASLKTFPLSQLTVINDSAIRLGRTHFRISKEQATFFKTNEQILKKARLSVRYSTNRKIEEIIGLEINQSGKGFDHPVTLDGLNQSVNGSIRINARNVTVKNVKFVDYIYLTNQASATTQIVNVNANKLSQASLPKTIQRQVAPLSRIMIQGGTFGSIDLQRTNTRLQARGSASLNEVRTFANTSIQSTATAHIQSVLTGHQVTSLDLNGDVSNLLNASRSLLITGRTTIGELTMNRTQGRLEIEAAGSIANLNVSADHAVISAKQNTMIETVTLHTSAKVQSVRPINQVEVNGSEKNVIELDASVDQLIINNETTLTIGKDRVIERVQAEQRLTLEGIGTVESLILGERVKDVVLNVPVVTMTVKGKGHDTIRVSGGSSIERVILDGEAPVAINVPKINRVEATETNTGTVDTGSTEVIQNDVTGDKVTPPAPPVETSGPTSPVVTPPVIDPIVPPEEE